MEDAIDFISQWQTLVGSALGPFLAILLSAAGFMIKEKIEQKKARKEAIRRVEIALAKTLNDLFSSVDQLEYFIRRVNAIVDDVKKMSDNTTYALQETNFPPTINIYFNEELSKLRFKSYYLHNKILIGEYLIKWINNTIIRFRDDFFNLLRKNEFLTMRGGSPQVQRSAYIENLQGYMKMVSEFLEKMKNENAESIVQTKVYNLKLMKKYFRTLWKYERIYFRYFKTRKEMLKFKENLDLIGSINVLIKDDVNKLMNEAKK